MDELGMQQLLVDYVNMTGGFARKMSHRFNVGIADLLVKLPGDYPAGVLEVKQRDAPKSQDLVWKLDLTKAQERYLRDAYMANMPAGVASFTHERRSGPLIKRLRLLVLTYEEYMTWKGNVSAADHLPIEDKIGEPLTSWIQRCQAENENK